MGKKIFIDEYGDTLLFQYAPDKNYPVKLKVTILGFGFALDDRAKQTSIAKLRAQFVPKYNEENVCDVSLIKMGATHAEQARMRPKSVELYLGNYSPQPNHKFFIESKEEIVRSYVYLDVEEL